MENATDFSWASAKASHAVLLCEMERASLKWSDTPRIELGGPMPKSTHLTSKIG